MNSALLDCKSLFKKFLFIIVLFSSPIALGAISTESLPENLRPWVPWVMHGNEREACPWMQGAGEKRCIWSGPLKLDLNAGAGRFSHSWQVFADSEVPLPGDKDHWPQEVKVGGQAAAVVPRNGKPFLQLKPGTYQVTGSFLWSKLPESLAIPPEIGLLHLTVNGEEKAFPQVDESGLLWIQKENAA
ncbi:MAG TPA: hypothetical protein DF383_08410, partial [Deltaproteobacteria bacterium]|nr:hypothetical protein [Deltaproteobacteria bacterium]